MAVDGYDMHMLLGEWHLSFVQLAPNSADFFRAYHIRYGHHSLNQMQYNIAGVRG